MDMYCATDFLQDRDSICLPKLPDPAVHLEETYTHAVFLGRLLIRLP